jgi:hypothetical protein
MHDLRNARLIFEVEPFLGAAGKQQVTAPPRKIVGTVEAPNSAAVESRADKVRGPLTPWTYLPIQ